MASLEIRALDDSLSFGAEVTGVTSNLLGQAEVRGQLQQLFEDRGVIVFRGVEPSAAMQVEISQVFGPLKEHPVSSVERAEDRKSVV